MSVKRHYNKISFATLMFCVSGLQRIQIFHCKDFYEEGDKDVLFKGTYNDLRKDKNLSDELEYMEISNVEASHDLLIIGVR